ncbi:cupin domain-containing protein [Streptomyces sp. SID3343]|uniref:cupin domain-containing protein n=1 Tax=Streptomyces sp. SID3343 TaxID=2690260 RepID=UPI00136A2051|nr:cupin domain-containing protein [Streptomyces sp. SID3343]MYW04729.1 cupin domain-containing protein [Streptomyces sp. SID3343]
MSHFAATPYDPVIVRGDEAEHLPEIGHHLLADAGATDGALSAHRIRLARGADGAVPHRHDHSSELFFVVDGALDLLVGTEIVVARPGDFLVVPPHCDHAFRAHPDSTADALIVITPGIDRFDYLRHVARIRRGEADRNSLLCEQDRYDTHFVAGTKW